jgi:hypothetical protein
MGISIKNDEVERMIRDLCALTNLGLTDAIFLAVKECLDARRKESSEEHELRMKELDEAIARFRAMPVYDPRGHADMLYDKDGLPK